ncbi:MAG TPA: hypothetical protein VLY85_04950 [Thermoplasmata archaeon]|nr:hypothetical protein [Thermoplasmata archaeon]
MPQKRREGSGSLVPPPGVPSGARHRIVVKFGGAALATGELVSDAARLVLEDPAEEKLVVVSAPQGMTDRLIDLVGGLPEPVEPAEAAHVIGYGERISARLFASALRSRGASVRLLEPEDADWPVLTERAGRDAEIDLERSRRRIAERLVPILRRSIVVLGGFLGRSGTRSAVLRRGGGDTSAVALGACLGADEVVLVKEVPGVLSADPDAVSDARPLREISAEALTELGRGGARIVAPEALAYLSERTRLRIIPLGVPLGAAGGTTVRATAGPRRIGVRPPASGTPKDGSVTVLFEEAAPGLATLIEVVGGRPWSGLSATRTSATIVAPETEIPSLVSLLHRSGAFRAVASRPKLPRSRGPSRPIAPIRPGSVGKAGPRPGEPGRDRLLPPIHA